MQIGVTDLTSRLNARLVGDPSTFITGIAGVDGAEAGDLVFAESPRYLQEALKCRAAAVLVTEELAAGFAQLGMSTDKALLVVPQPRIAFVQVLEMFAPPRSAPSGIDPAARVGEGAQIGADVSIAACVVVGARAVIGDGVTLSPGVVVGAEVSIGAGSFLHPNVVIYPGVRVGRGCILHAGAVIGADGFGYVPVGHSLKKVPQLGTVEIGDEVEIGANTCVDRAKTGTTRIGSGTKIDNLVHVAHNVTIGQSCLIIAQAGIAGSVTIGNGVVLAGQAGIKDHVRLGDGARVAAQGGVIGDVEPGVTVSGYPARPHLEKMRELGALTALPSALKRLRAIEKRLEELVARLPADGAGVAEAQRASADAAEQ